MVYLHHMDPTWREALAKEFNKGYYRDLCEFVKQERDTHTIYPRKDLVFSAFKLTPLDRVKVVLLGQDPYHGAGQAHGLSFSVLPGITPPPSLKNIFKELQSDLGVQRTNPCLISWAEQGVLMLNTVMTVRAGIAASHQGRGWERFTGEVLNILNSQTDPLVFVLWGNAAKTAGKDIDINKHLVIESAHPSPMSAHYGFFGSKPFSRINDALESLEKSPIDWSL